MSCVTGSLGLSKKSLEVQLDELYNEGEGNNEEEEEEEEFSDGSTLTETSKETEVSWSNDSRLDSLYFQSI